MTREITYKWQFGILGLVKLGLIILAWNLYGFGAAAIAFGTWIEISLVSRV